MIIKSRILCQGDKCTGCMACVAMCPKNAITVYTNIENCKAEIETQKCINCGLCERICPSISLRQQLYPIYWKQGWAQDHVRDKSSSGGAAAEIIKTFINLGGYVASCMYSKGEFGFKVTNNLEVASCFAGSKYVKSNPGNIYREINRLLKKGEKVLFVGLPCQSAAVLNTCREQDNLYTIDLVCHGTPSPLLLKQYLEECGFEWDSVEHISFRDKNKFGLSINGNALLPKRIVDSYTRAFLKNVDYTENCYYCRYSTINRVSDITLGDAWGRLADNNPKGVSLVLCQTHKGIDLVQKANLYLQDVNLEKVIRANHQLDHPSIKHPNRDKFLTSIKKGNSFRKTITSIFPKESIKQSIKMGLIKIGIINGNK